MAEESTNSTESGSPGDQDKTHDNGHEQEGHVQLSFAAPAHQSRLIIKTESIFPIEFEHLDESGSPILRTEPSSSGANGDLLDRPRKSGHRIHSAPWGNEAKRIGTYKFNSRGAKNVAYAQLNLTSADRIRQKELNENISKVLEKLLTNYDRNQPPGHGQGKARFVEQFSDRLCSRA